MTERVIDTVTVQLSQNDLQISAYLAKPSAPGSYPGVVVLQEIFGVNDHIREVTERIALEGYVAIRLKPLPRASHQHSSKEMRLGLRAATQTKILRLAEPTPCKPMPQSY